MVTLTATQASRGFSQLLSRVEQQAESVTITRDGRPVALIRPVEPGPGRVSRTGSEVDLDDLTAQINAAVDAITPDPATGGAAGRALIDAGHWEW